MPGRSIAELCEDPRLTRARARRGDPVPCYRCIAWSGVECALIDAQRWVPIDTTEAPTMPLFPTSDEPARIDDPTEEP